MKKRSTDDSLESVSELKRRIQTMEQSLAERFWAGGEVEDLVRERANFIDGFLCELWHHWFEYDETCALFAVGGYGRRELHPKSDIDLLILVNKRQRNSEQIGEFIRLLWDLQLEIGHSVRTVSECKVEAKRDLTIMTALNERRLLIGSSRLAQKLDRTLDNRKLWSSRRFFNGKLEEQNARHEHYSDIEYGLEPNVKSSPGGLRDIQFISWITEHHCDTKDLNELVEREFLTERECKTLIDGRLFLWKVRFALHLLSKRREDQLYFDHQREIAKRFGYEDSEGLLAVEGFMQDYYRLVLELREVNDILIQHFSEAILKKRRKLNVQPINENFQICNDYIETTSPDVFKRNASALLEIFVIMANQASIKGVRANTIRQIRRHLHLIDNDFRFDKGNGELFLTLLRSPYTVVSQLTRMRRYGILGKYIPQFGRIIGQMQHDLFHIYTVDAHTMALLRNLRRMFMAEYEQEFPCIRPVVTRITQVELLFIAGLFHDLGKGRGGNHSELGAVDCANFCDQVGIEGADKELVVWLVQRHLYMSKTSQREDVSDPTSVRKFANVVQSQRRLDYLMALTVADIHATNPKEWNAWRESLLVHLYNATRAMLKDGMNDANLRLSALERRQQETVIALENKAANQVNLDSFWDDITDGFVLAHEADALAEIANAVTRKEADDSGVVLLLESASDDLMEIFVHTEDRPRLFADFATALDQLNLDVMNASIATGKSGYCYDSFIVMTHPDEKLDDARVSHIRSRLTAVMEERAVPKRRSRRRISRQLKQFKVATRITIDNIEERDLFRLEIVTADRPGLLALISTVFVEFDIELHQARITTLGERADDVFVVSSEDPQAFISDQTIQNLIERMTARIDAELLQMT